MYGQSKLGGEFEVDLECAVVRTSWVIGRYGANMAKTILRLAAGDAPLRFVDDQRGCPTVAADLAHDVAHASWSNACPAPGTSRTRAR